MVNSEWSMFNESTLTATLTATLTDTGRESRVESRGSRVEGRELRVDDFNITAENRANNWQSDSNCVAGRSRHSRCPAATTKPTPSLGSATPSTIFMSKLCYPLTAPSVRFSQVLLNTTSLAAESPQPG